MNLYLTLARPGPAAMREPAIFFFLNSLKILPICLQNRNNRLIFAPFKHHEGVRCRPNIGGNFYATTLRK